MDKPGMRLMAVAFASVLLLEAGTAFPQMPGGVGAPGGSSMPNPSLPSPIPGQNPNPMNGMISAALDRTFVERALEAGMAEVQLGQLASEKSGNSQVKQFAQQMTDDHTMMNSAMIRIAQRLEVSVPAKLSKKDRRTMAKLSALSGTEFDQAYIKYMVSDHQAYLHELQDEVSSGQDQQVKDAATRDAKTVNEHLQTAEQMAKDQNVSAGSN